MGRTITDLNIQAGYPYEINLDLNTSAGVGLEDDYNCYFECASIVSPLQFNVVDDAYLLEISKENTDKLLTNLEQYTVYTINISSGKYDKLLEGRIHVNNKVRA